MYMMTAYAKSKQEDLTGDDRTRRKSTALSWYSESRSQLTFAEPQADSLISNEFLVRARAVNYQKCLI
jgi:hypothetical protein